MDCPIERNGGRRPEAEGGAGLLVAYGRMHTHPRGQTTPEPQKPPHLGKGTGVVYALHDGFHARHHSGLSDAGPDRAVAREPLTAHRLFYRIINAIPCRTLLQSDCVMLSDPRYAAARVSIVRWISPRQALAISPANQTRDVDIS